MLIVAPGNAGFGVHESEVGTRFGPGPDGDGLGEGEGLGDGGIGDGGTYPDGAFPQLPEYVHELKS